MEAVEQQIKMLDEKLPLPKKSSKKSISDILLIPVETREANWQKAYDEERKKNEMFELSLDEEDF